MGGGFVLEARGALFGGIGVVCGKSEIVTS